MSEKTISRYCPFQSLVSNSGFGDFVPGDAVLNADTQDGQYKLILACIYVLLGMFAAPLKGTISQTKNITFFAFLLKYTSCVYSRTGCDLYEHQPHTGGGHRHVHQSRQGLRHHR
jgi:hypothetical protein